MDDDDQLKRDQWQTLLYETSYRFASSIKELTLTNPWPEISVLEHAVNAVMTELWDNAFSMTEIRTAFQEAINDMPRYTANEELRR